MRKLIILVTILLPFIPGLKAQKSIFPDSPTAWVNDYAGILNRSENSRLNEKLGYYEDSTSTQIFVVTLNETQGAEISILASEIGHKWGVGQKGKDNGLLILIIPDERKIWIAPGYGLEEFLPDIVISKIINTEITPSFRNGNYYEGLDKATDVIMGLLSGKFTADQYSRKGVQEEAPFAGIIMLVIILIIIFMSKNRGYTTLKKDIPFWIAMGMLSGSRHSHSGSFGDFSSGSGGFGGFSGGGGGGFGGGGAGGSW